MKKQEKTSVELSTQKKRSWATEIRVNWQLYLMILIPFAYLIVFKYYPMFGTQIGFRDYQPTTGIWGSEWVGFRHFERFFNNPQWIDLIKNTMAISIYTIVLSIPFPIMLAIAFDYARSRTFKKTVQMVTYLPHFLSTVIIVSLMQLLFNMQSGVVNNVVEIVSGTKINFLGMSKYFRSLYVWSGIWQGVGWSSILYISALSGVDPQLHEAALIDGASKIKRIWHIDIPSIIPTIAIMTIMNMGTLLSVGFDKTFLMQNPTNLEVSQVLSTYEYNVGLGGGIPSYSYPAAIGLMSSVVTFILICVTNKISKKLSDSGLW